MRIPLAALMLLSCACSGPAGGLPERPPQRPNLLLVMTDDQGFGDYGFAGNPVLETPHLDALAAASPRVERFYVSPVCSPTRASLLTGRYNYRTRVVDTWRGRTSMEPEEVTLAEVLREAGYRTGIFGKWHLGDNHPQRPQDQGFDEVLVHRGGGLDQASEPIENARRYTDPILFHNGEQVGTEGYCTDVYVDAALEFIDGAQASGQPFFAYVATNAPHGPFHDVPEELYAKYKAADLSGILRGEDARPDQVARILAMTENIDQNVGRLLAHLEQRGLDDDTLVVFLGDNGPTWGRWAGGLRGFKTGVYEGGIRSPLLMRYGEQLSPATRVGTTAAHIDLFPTLLEALGVPTPEEVALDGRSLWPELSGHTAQVPARHLVIQTHRGDVPRYEHHFAVIGPRWKLVRASGFGREAPPQEHPFELYDLRDDPAEARDLAAERPELVAELREVYRRWWEDVTATRQDNFAPPPIVLDALEEPRALLQRNDWRGVGTGTADGAWHIEVDGTAWVEARLLFREPLEVSEVLFADWPREPSSLSLEPPTRARPVNGVDGSAGYVIDDLRVALTDAVLRVRCRTTTGEEVSPYQLELLHRPAGGPLSFDLR